MSSKTYGLGRFTAAEYDLDYNPRVFNKKYPLVVFMAGGSDTPVSAPLGGAIPAMDALVDAGFVVVQPSVGTGGAAYGNATAMARVNAAKAYAQARLGCRDGRIVVSGTSNGGITALQYTRQYDVAATVTFIAPIDLYYMRDNNISGTAAGINTAAGVTGTDPFPAHFDLWTDAASYAGKPILQYSSSNDPLRNPANTQQAWAAAVGAEWHDLGATGHDYNSMGTVVPADVVEFVLDNI